MATASKTFLHVGCGEKAPQLLPPLFCDGTWEEVRLDINPAVRPDIVASMTDMSAVVSGNYDAVFSSHNLEHLYPHQVDLAVQEFARVLKSDGFLLVTCPDLQSVAALVAEGNISETVYVSPAGPIAPLDIIYGFQRDLADGNEWMAHRTGFTVRSLGQYLARNGFAEVTVERKEEIFALVGIAYREKHPKVLDRV